MSTHIPREFIDQLLQRVDIVDYIDGRITIRKKTGSNYFACCPFHNEKSPSFSISQTKQFYYCFGCGAHGNVVDFLMKYDRLSFPEAIETLARQAGMEIPQENASSAKTSHKKTSLYELLEQVSKFFQTQLRQNEKAIDYFKQRGVSGEIAKLFNLGFAPPGWENLAKNFENCKSQLAETGMLIKKEDGGFYDRFRDRIMFPIHDNRGRVVGFGGRIIDQGEPKYLNSPETPIFQKGHELYGLYQALNANRQLQRVLVVEGYMDVVALFQHEITYAVATLGTATTSNHLERLFRYTSEIIFCFDGDQAGSTAAWRALQVTLPLMHDGLQVRFLFLPENEDPDSLVRKEGKENFEKRISTAFTIADFFFQTLATKADVLSTDGRARFVKLATDMLKQLPDGIFLQMMLDELAKRARIDVNQLKPQPTPKNYKKPSSSIKPKPPSSLRQALTLLIQNPHLVELISEPLTPLDMKGFDLFLKVVELTQQNPNITTGMLLEYWRDNPEATLLAKLAQAEYATSGIKLEQEFSGAIKQLRKLATDSAIEKLLNKAAQQALSHDERQLLNTLISNKS